MDKISIVLEAVENAKAVLAKTIADIEKIDQANAKSDTVWKRLNQTLQEHDKILLGVKVASGAVIAATLLMTKAAIANAEEMFNMSQAAGTTAENFSTMAFAAKNANLSNQELLIGFKQLSLAIVDASRGNADAINAFKALRVEYRNADGTLKNTSALILEISDAFARAEDGPTKAAIAQRLFGRSSQELISFLNQGSDAIKQQQEQARALGLEISTKTAVAADTFGDNMNALKGVLQGLANQIAAQLLPVLIRLQEWLLRNPELIKAAAVAVTALAVAITAATVAWKAYVIAGEAAALVLGVGAVKNAKDYLAAIQLLAATPWIAYTAGIAGAVAIVYAGVEAWKAYKAAQEEATSEERLTEFNARTDNALKRQIAELKNAGKITEQEAQRMSRALSQAFLAGNPDTIAKAQNTVRNKIRDVNGLGRLNGGGQKGDEAKTQLSLPDPALEKAKIDAVDKLVAAGIDNRLNDVQQGLKVEQALLDDSLKRQTISLDDWRAQQKALDEKQIAEQIAAENNRFSLQQSNLQKSLELATDPKDKAALNGEIEVLQITHESKLTQIQTDGTLQRLATDQKYFDQRKALVDQDIANINERTSAAEADFQARINEISVGEKTGEFVNVYAEINTAKDEYIAKLKEEQDKLNKILATMDAINKKQPGTFNQKDQAAISTAIEKNEKAQVDSEKRVTDAKRQLQQQQLGGVQDMFGNMAQAAKAFGKEGFAAYKALAIAQATVNTASAAIAAYQSVVGIPYVGPVLAPIAAAAAVAAGAAQIASIAAQKYATGGLITGPGSGTSDEVPILASNREFIVRNAIVEQPGAQAFLQDFNARGMAALSFPGAVVPASSPRGRRFAEGGLVTAGGGGSSDSEQAGGINISLALLNDRKSKRDYLRRDGMKVVLSELQRRGNLVSL